MLSFLKRCLGLQLLSTFCLDLSFVCVRSSVMSVGVNSVFFHLLAALSLLSALSYLSRLAVIWCIVSLHILLSTHLFLPLSLLLVFLCILFLCLIITLRMSVSCAVCTFPSSLFILASVLRVQQQAHGTGLLCVRQAMGQDEAGTPEHGGETP